MLTGIYGLAQREQEAKKVIRPVTDSEDEVMTGGHIKDLFQDSRGDIWIATEGNGLYRYNEGSKVLKQYTRDDGLPGMIVQAVQEGITLYCKGILP